MPSKQEENGRGGRRRGPPIILNKIQHLSAEVLFQKLPGHCRAEGCSLPPEHIGSAAGSQQFPSCSISPSTEAALGDKAAAPTPGLCPALAEGTRIQAAPGTVALAPGLQSRHLSQLNAEHELLTGAARFAQRSPCVFHFPPSTSPMSLKKKKYPQLPEGSTTERDASVAQAVAGLEMKHLPPQKHLIKHEECMHARQSER